MSKYWTVRVISGKHTPVMFCDGELKFKADPCANKSYAESSVRARNKRLTIERIARRINNGD